MKKILLIIVLCALFFSFFTWVFIELEDKKVVSDDGLKLDNLETQTYRKGVNDGTNSLIIYLQETKQIDSIKIQLERLLEIQDSIK